MKLSIKPKDLDFQFRVNINLNVIIKIITMTPTLHMEIKELTALQDVLDAMMNSHPMVPFNSLQLAIPTVMSAIAITISHLP